MSNEEIVHICDDHAYYSTEEPCPKCAENAAVLEPSKLPATLGFRHEHKVISNQLIRRVVELLSQSNFKVNSQSIRDLGYSELFQESISLEFNDGLHTRVAIEVTQKKG